VTVRKASSSVRRRDRSSPLLEDQSADEYRIHGRDFDEIAGHGGDVSQARYRGEEVLRTRGDHLDDVGVREVGYRTVCKDAAF
jgi:hypothetical protein